MELLEIFRNFDFSDAELEKLQSSFTLQHYQPGEVIINRGDRSDSFYCVLSGELTAVVTDDNGEELTLGVVQPGEFFGEIGLLNKAARTATVRSLTHSQVYCTDEKVFFELLEKSPSFASFIRFQSLKHLVSRVPEFSQLGDADIGRIISLHETQSFKAGNTICKQGDTADRIAFVVSGRASVNRRERDATIVELQGGDCFGDDVFFKGKRYLADLQMTEDGEVLIIEREALIRLVNQYPSIAAELPLRKGIIKSILPYFYDKSAYLAIPAMSMNRPRMMMWGTVYISLLLMVLAVLPSIWPQQFPFLNGLHVDTDPENMLSEQETSRVFHNQMKHEMNLHDLMVVGVVNDKHPDGIYNTESLRHLHELAEYAAKQYWTDDDGKVHGVINVDIMAPSTVDNISQGGPGVISFSWLMPTPPQTQAEALAIRDNIKRLPLMNATLASTDDRAIALYLPLTAKDVSYQVYQQMLEKIETFEGDDQFFITGLPVAEDSFGVEMFIQMAVSAPMAMLVIFLLMYLFFRNLTLIYAPMIVAMISVIATMSLLIISGQTVHIMSSMIPIFIMPIAVLDSVHILSEFFDYYPKIKSRRHTMNHVMRELFVPMFYTSMTTAIGFASLALVPIPPVQVFGIFVALGVIFAWLLSISLIPAYVFLVKKEKIEVLATEAKDKPEHSGGMLAGLLQAIRRTSQTFAGRIVMLSVLLMLGFIYGITQIVVNDNPIRWFKEGHPISVADRILNDHFAGTYMAYMAFKAVDTPGSEVRSAWQQHLDGLRAEFTEADNFISRMSQAGNSDMNASVFLDAVEAMLEIHLDSDEITETEEELAETMLDWVDEERQRHQVFKQPAMLNYLSDLQQHLLGTGVVGKSIAIGDFVKTVNRELHSGSEEYYRIPASASAVAQTLLTYQNSHRPQDVWKFVTTDYRQGIVWLMLNSGDNVDMSKVINAAESYMAANPPPFAVEQDWFGLNYINVVWQEKMVNGMMYSILGSYLAVMLIMVFLLRSIWWSLIAMLPLTFTMLVIYGMLGLAGKSYDMPVAVLSALAIGLAVDFAIHSCVRMRHLHSQTSDWKKSLEVFYTEPAQAILRNLLVVAIGFLPLLLAPLVPYNTVGNLIAAILFTSGLITLVLTPSIFKLASKILFKIRDDRRTTSFGMREAIYAAIVGLALVAVTIEPILPVSTDTLPAYLGMLLLVAYQLFRFRKKQQQAAEAPVRS